MNKLKEVFDHALKIIEGSKTDEDSVKFLTGFRHLIESSCNALEDLGALEINEVVCDTVPSLSEYLNKDKENRESRNDLLLTEEKG